MREKLLTLPLAELRKIAKEQGLKAVSGYRKSELVDKLCELAGESVPKTEEASPKREESLPKTEEALPGTEEALPRAEEPAERAAAPERRRIIQRRPERMSTPRERAYPQSAPRPQERPQPQGYTAGQRTAPQPEVLSEAEKTELSDLDSSLSKSADFIGDDGNQGKTMDYSYKNVNKKFAFYNLDNGMKLVLTAPVSEIYAEAYGLAKLIIIAMIVAFVLSAVIGVIIGTGMTRPIRQLTAVIEQTAELDFRPTKEGGKLRKQKDEIGNMATKIHIMRKKLREMMGDLQQTQQVLESNAEDLNHLMKQNSAYAEDNSAATQELAAGMEETSANAAHIVENVGIMRESSDNIQRLAEDGEKNSGQIQERAGEMERISTESRHKTDQMYAVMKQKTDAAVEQAKSVQKINALTDNIKQISSQTNLLALNANIEAARAGEAGRGFAVVASEIGDLATQTLDTVSTIDEIVGEVNSSVSNMTECLTTIMEFLEQTVLGDYEHFAQVGEQYHADADTFQQIMQQTKEAVDALEQHIGEISSTISEINSMVEQSTDGISGIAEKSGSTQNLVTEGYDKLQECTQSVNVIRDFVAQFHLD